MFFLCPTQTLHSLNSLIDQIEAGSYHHPLPDTIDPVACQILLLALLMEVSSTHILSVLFVQPGYESLSLV